MTIYRYTPYDTSDYAQSQRADAPQPIDENALQAAGERVAQWHIDNCTAEFVEWLDNRISAGEVTAQTLAAIICALPREAHHVQMAKGIADTIVGDFRVFVANADERDWWPVARRLAAEVRKEAL